MIFVTNDVLGIAQYAPEPADFYATETVWFNRGDTVEADFDRIVESLFIRDILEGKLAPADEEARDYIRGVINEI